jgi:hypothetical protein
MKLAAQVSFLFHTKPCEPRLTSQTQMALVRSLTGNFLYASSLGLGQRSLNDSPCDMNNFVCSLLHLTWAILCNPAPRVNYCTRHGTLVLDARCRMHWSSISLHKQLTVHAFSRKLSLIIPPSGRKRF